MSHCGVRACEGHFLWGPDNDIELQEVYHGYYLTWGCLTRAKLRKHGFWIREKVLQVLKCFCQFPFPPKSSVLLSAQCAHCSYWSPLRFYCRPFFIFWLLLKNKTKIKKPKCPILWASICQLGCFMVFVGEIKLQSHNKSFPLEQVLRLMWMGPTGCLGSLLSGGQEFCWYMVRRERLWMLLNPSQHARQPSSMGNYPDCVNMLTLRSLVVGWGGGPSLLFLLTFALTPGL